MPSSNMEMPVALLHRFWESKRLLLATPYAVQVQRAIRNAELKQVLFSEYALRKDESAEDKAVQKLQNLYATQVCGKDSWSGLSDGQKDYFYRLRPDLI